MSVIVLVEKKSTINYNRNNGKDNIVKIYFKCYYYGPKLDAFKFVVLFL